MYMELPYGFSNDSEVPVILIEMRRGFKPSAIDPCVYLRKDCILLVYVDDCIIVVAFLDYDPIYDLAIIILSA